MKIELNPKPAFCYACGQPIKFTHKTAYGYKEHYECETGHRFFFIARDNMGDCDMFCYIWPRQDSI